MRDTIYFGYDPNAHISDHPLEDSIFGQKLQWVGTTKFYCWINDPDICHVDPSQCDSQFKVNVTPELGNTFPVGWNNVGFKNGMLPLKISQDISTLYSDSLPFPFSPGLPHAQGRFYGNSATGLIQMSENGQIIPTGTPFPVLLSDTGSLGFKDSCTVRGIGFNNFPVEYFSLILYFEAWTGIATSIRTPLKQDLIIGPNPIHDYFNIEFLNPDTKISANILILDMMGRIVFKNKLSSTRTVMILPSTILLGTYILSVISKSCSFNKRVVVN